MISLQEYWFVKHKNFSVWKVIRFDKIYENVNNIAIRMKARNSCFKEYQKSYSQSYLAFSILFELYL